MFRFRHCPGLDCEQRSRADVGITSSLDQRVEDVVTQSKSKELLQNPQRLFEQTRRIEKGCNRKYLYSPKTARLVEVTSRLTIPAQGLGLVFVMPPRKRAYHLS